MMVLKMLLQMALKRLRLPRRTRKEATDEERKAAPSSCSGVSVGLQTCSRTPLSRLTPSFLLLLYKMAQ